MDQILFVNSASFIDISVSSSLYVAQGTNVDFSLATQVSGSFVGTLTGNATSATTASYALNSPPQETASYAINAGHADASDTSTSASHAGNADTATTATSSSYSLYAGNAASSSYVVGQQIKSGVVSGSSFNSNNPCTYDVAFVSAFPSVIYSITITGGDARTWLAQNRTTTGFTINSNSKTKPATFVYWQAIASGEFNS